jgi:hypothetical protein
MTKKLRRVRVLATCKNCGFEAYAPAALKWKCPECGHPLVRGGRVPLTEGQKRLGLELGMEILGDHSSDVMVNREEYQRLRCREVFWRTLARKYAAKLKNRPTASICAFCELRAPDDKRCPMNKIPKGYDIVVWVDECDQWRPRPSERK